MAATYSKSLITDRDKARLLLGDTDITAALLDDSEIDGMLATFAYKEAVAQLATSLATRFAQDPDTYEADGGVKVAWSQRIKQWNDLAKQMRSIVEAPTVTTPRPGISVGVLSTPDTSKLRF